MRMNWEMVHNSFLRCYQYEQGQGLANDRGCTALTWDGPACVRVQGR
ncbi:hypothetical protein FVEG_15084 [Fusarium verticillioides 7600]|uniref:Uncharacterized protein n=1 Tax=Gibberella moniliformis (strain M3125 / FGSC 7600) TaxID=334819 RepID=W7M4S2_GIBM7|nr:hypothetical protein FVEG_15084 [Fusarium verticillioides 7600]EWG39877.1 hypothetical protein FVEG_15084 [Fusarium verticillioides 7600]